MIATFVLGDVVGSTKAWESSRDSMPDALAALDNLVDAAAATHQGERPIEQGEGDSFVVTFMSASDACAFAIDVQRGLHDSDGLEVRMAIHTGEAERRDDGRWLGPTLNRCARLRSLAAGGQVLVSGATAALVIDALPPGASLRDLGQHRLRDLATPELVRQLCHPDLLADFAPLPSLERLPNNLPLELSSFVGRDAECAEVGAILGRSRMVTLTGAGGAGKTRLALHVAADHLDDAPDGAWLVDLAGIVDPALVPSVLAMAMRVSEQPPQPVIDTLAYRLANSRALVIVDNCEHLLDASASLAARLLQSCANVRVIATSREPLGIEGEVVYRIPSLDASAAATLFTERAQAVRPSFGLDARTAPAVTNICERLDGMPLAIELAAARVRAMSPAEIETQLADRFRLLNAGRRGALPRQRTLEASVQWSHDLLTDDERVALRRLSVFAGGFALRAAEHVVGGDGIDEWHVVDLLTALVDRSLVQAEDDGERTRYRLLETVRVFAAQRLAEADEVDAARTKHVAAVLSFTTERWPMLHSDGFAAALADITGDFDNIRAALDWAIETGDFESAMLILAGADSFWALRLPAEGLQRVRSTLALTGGDDPARFRLCSLGAWFAWWQADSAALHDMAQQGARSAEKIGDPALLAAARLPGVMDLYLQRDQRCLGLLSEVVADAEASGDGLTLVFSLAALAATQAAAGELRAARASIQRAADLAYALGDPLLIFANLAGAATITIYAGDIRAVRSYVESQAETAAMLGDTMTTTMRDLALAWVAASEGDYPYALRVVDDVEKRELARAVGIGLYEALCQGAWLRRRAGASWDASLSAYLSARATSAGMAFDAWFEAGQAEDLLALGEIDNARSTAQAALDIARSTIYERVCEPGALRMLARVTLAGGDPAAAENYVHEALGLSVDRGEDYGVAEAFDILASLAGATGAHADAARMLGASDAVRDELLWTRGVNEQVEVDGLAGDITAALDGDAYETARGEGRAMSRDDAIAFAQRGRGKRGRPSFGWASLTPTENEVARLVAEGLANKAIAEKLFMSPATVKTHLTHIYAKLAVASRTELAAQAAQRP